MFVTMMRPAKSVRQVSFLDFCCASQYIRDCGSGRSATQHEYHTCYYWFANYCLRTAGPCTRRHLLEEIFLGPLPCFESVMRGQEDSEIYVRGALVDQPSVGGRCRDRGAEFNLT